MGSRARRSFLIAILACSVVLGAGGSLAIVELKYNRRGLAPPAELFALGPIWIGDFCRYNVAHHRYPPGWCPRDYTVYLIVDLGSRGVIYPMFNIRDSVPLPKTT